MPRIRFRKILNILIEICYLSIVFFIPVYFALFLKNANVFELNKIVLFKIIVLLFLLLTLIKIIICRNAPWRVPAINKKYLLIPLLFLLSLALSAVFSINQENSFYGLYSRQQGLVSYIYYFAFFLLLLLNVKTKEQINRIIITAVLSSSFVSLYGIIQMAGFDFLNWIEPAILTKRVSSTFGQPNFLASYLILVIPLAGYLFFQSKKFLIKFFWLIILLFQLLCLFFTGSRAGWVGLFFGIIFTGALYLLLNKKNISSKYFNPPQPLPRGELSKPTPTPPERRIKYFKPRFLLFGLLALIIIAVFFFSSDCYFASRIKSLADITKGSNAARMNFYKASVSAVKDKPILGYGLENQGEVFVKHYEKDWAEIGRVNSYPNRAHNLFLDIILTSGFVGLIFYLALLYLFFKLAIDNIKNNKSKFLSWFILFANISYLISLMFGFSVVATDIYFWLFFAVIVIINSETEKDVLCDYKHKYCVTTHCHCEESEMSVANERRRSNPAHYRLPAFHGIASFCFRFTRNDNSREQLQYCLLIKLLKFILIAIISIGIFFQISKEFKKLIADHYFRELQLSYVNQEYFKAFTLYDYIKKTKIKIDYYDRNFGIMLADQMRGFNGLASIRTGEEALENIIKNLSNNNYPDIFAKAKIYTALASNEKQDYYNLAEENFKKVISLSPEMPKNYRELANIYAKKGDYQKAMDNYNKALSCLPDLDNEKINSFHKGFIEHEIYLINKGLENLYQNQ